MNCPKCNVVMRLKLSTRGSSAGRYFWGCRNYPTCMETVAARPADLPQRYTTSLPLNHVVCPHCSGSGKESRTATASWLASQMGIEPLSGADGSSDGLAPEEHPDFKKLLLGLTSRSFQRPCALCNGQKARLIPEIPEAEAAIRVELLNYQKVTAQFWAAVAALSTMQQQFTAAQSARANWHDSLGAEQDLQLLQDERMLEAHVEALRNSKEIPEEGMAVGETERARLAALNSPASRIKLQHLVVSRPDYLEMGNQQYALGAQLDNLKATRYARLALVVESMLRLESIRSLLSAAEAKVAATMPVDSRVDEFFAGPAITINTRSGPDPDHSVDRENYLRESDWELESAYPLDDLVMAPSRREEAHDSFGSASAYDSNETIDYDGEEYVDRLFFHRSDDPGFGDEE